MAGSRLGLRCLLIVVGLLLAACVGDSLVQAGSDSTSDGSYSAFREPVERPLAAVLEHAFTLVSDFGSGWGKVDEWYTEGAITEWSSGCGAFDRLGDMFNFGTPQTSVWERGGERAFNRTDDFNWSAYEFAYDVERVPDSCSEVTVDSQTIGVSAVDETMFAESMSQLTEADPNAVIVAIMIDSYPVPSQETDSALPEFESDSPTWLVIATRENVVSQLVYAPGDGNDTTGIEQMVASQVSSLVEAPVEGSGNFAPPEPPPSVAPSTATGVELMLGECRNTGRANAGGVEWLLAGGAPFEWEDLSSVVGDLAMDGTIATFTPTSIDVPSGVTVQLTTGPVLLQCLSWERPEPVEPLPAVGPLDCGEQLVVEDRFADDDHDPEAIALEYTADAVRVEAVQQLQWQALDADGRVVALMAIGDIDNPEWQVWTCT